MSKKDEDLDAVIKVGAVIGGFALLGWLLSREKYKCPRCNNPVYKNQYQCSNCGQPLDWRIAR